MRKVQNTISSDTFITQCILNNQSEMSEIKFGFTAQQFVEEGRVAAEHIQKLRTWASTQHLPKLADEQFVIFLVSCSNDLEAARKTILAYFEVKNSCPKMFDNWKLDRADLQKQLKTCEICVMPERRSDGCAIMLARFQDFSYRSYDLAISNALLTMTAEALVYENPPSGMVCIMDLNGVGLMHLTRLQMDAAKAGAKFLKEGLPVDLREIHLINAVYFMDKVVAIAEPLLNKKIMNMLHFHQKDMDMEEFYEKWIPKRCLPEDYGGDLPPVRILHQRNTENLLKMQPSFAAAELQRRSIKH